MGFWTYPAFCPVGTGVKAAWYEAVHSPPFNGGAIPPLPIHLHGMVFTFILMSTIGSGVMLCSLSEGVSYF
jgi:hypothetical protein